MEIKRSQSKEFRLWTVLKFKVWASLGTKLEQMVLTAFDAQQIARKATFNHHRGEILPLFQNDRKQTYFATNDLPGVAQVITFLRHSDFSSKL